MKEPHAPHEWSGCVSLFVGLWAVAALCVGGLITLVSGYCGVVMLREPANYGYWLPFLVIGVLLCWHALYLLGRSRNQRLPPPVQNARRNDQVKDPPTADDA